MEKIFWASALLYDNKIKFWRISESKKARIEDFYKDFYYANEDMVRFLDDSLCRIECMSFESNEDDGNYKVFNELAPKYFSQWKLVDDFVGFEPY